MSVYIVTGKLGNGKTLVTVGRIRDALLGHHRVATNLDINLKNMFGKSAKNINLVRVPDKPSIDDLNNIGMGYEGKYDESKFGSLILDECGTWFNSRNWQDKTRREVNDWFLHARKLRWHVYIIIQDISILDAQARDAIGEMLVVCRRLDNLRVPLIGGLIKTLTGFNLTLPRIHRAKVTYADGLLCDVWVYRGNDLFSCYQTDQMFLQNYKHGVYSMLSPWHTHGRYAVQLNKENLMRLTKIHWRRFKSPVAMACGFLLGISAMVLNNARNLEHEISQKIYDTNSPTQQQKKPAEVAPAQEQKSKDEESKSFVDRLRIIGFFTLNEVKNYTFSTGEPDRYLTSLDVSGMGVEIKPLSDCMVEMTFNGKTSLVRCL
jgi:hypothetical protein